MSFPDEIQTIMQKIRKVISNSAPDSIETMGYGVPAFKQKEYLVYYAAFKNHIGFYPTPKAIEKFKNELKEYDTAKGTIKFPLNKPIPYDLIEKIVKFRVKEVSIKI